MRFIFIKSAAKVSQILMLSIIVCLILCVIGLKIYLTLTTGWCRSQTCLVGKTAIVTGGDSGIGYKTALNFAKRGARVIITSLNLNDGLAAREKIISKTDNTNIIVKPINLKSFQSVRAFAKDIEKNEPVIDILVNNAGVGVNESELTEDGLGSLMQINYFSLFLLTNLLLEKLKLSKNARIVNVSSFIAVFGHLNLSTFHTQAYSTSKLCVTLFTRELAKKLKGTSVTTYSVHPGLVNTQIFDNVNILLLYYAKIFKTPEEGAQTSIRVAVEKNIENLNGEQLHDCDRVFRYYNTYNEDLARKLWTKTEKIVKKNS